MSSRSLCLYCALIVRNLPDRTRELVRMKMMVRKRLTALRTVAEKNEEAAQAHTIDAVDNEAVKAVRCNNEDDCMSNFAHRRRCVDS